MQLRLLLNLQKERTEIVEPSAVEFRTDMLQPSFACLTDRDEPSDKKSTSETCDPNLAKFLIDMALPQCAKLRTDIAELSRPMLRILNEEPKCAN